MGRHPDGRDPLPFQLLEKKEELPRLARLACAENRPTGKVQLGGLVALLRVELRG